MKPLDRWILLLFGLAFWAIGTAWYRFCGTRVFETTSRRYWFNFILTPILSAAICILILRWRQIAAADWAAAGLLIALPGMLGEAALLSQFARFMPRLRPETAGRYGAFLFAAYGLFLTVAEIVSLAAAGMA